MFRKRVALSAALVAACLLPASAPAAYKVTVKRTAHGIAHIRANDFASMGYGYAYALAQDNICVIADSYVTVRGERSRYFGADVGYAFRSNGTSANNLNSDFFFKRIIDSKVIETLISEPPPAGPVPEIKQAVAGYVDGYNAYLAKTGVDAIPDPDLPGQGVGQADRGDRRLPPLLPAGAARLSRRGDRRHRRRTAPGGHA